jgi:uncharacterized protein (DUF1684 family)
MRLRPLSCNYYMRKCFASAVRIFNALCIIALFTNIGLLAFANINKMYDLKILSILNMMLLSFVLLREPKK